MLMHWLASQTSNTILKHNEEVINKRVWQRCKHWNHMQNDDISCKQHKYGMLEDSSIKASEVHNTRTMQYYAQTTKPVPK